MRHFVADILLVKQEENVTRKATTKFFKALHRAGPSIVADAAKQALPKSCEQALAMLYDGQHGLEMLEYHLCGNASCGFIYRGVYQALEECPVCGHPRFRDDRTASPFRRLYYCTIRSWLKLLFQDVEFAQHMQYHNQRERQQGDIADVYDGMLWTDVFAGDERIQAAAAADDRACGAPGRNVAVAFCCDGVSPNKRGGHSWWPCMLQCLNLPPWLRTRLDAFLLCCVVDGKTITADAQPVLELMIDELVYLYYFGHTVEDRAHGDSVNVRVMLLDTRFDHPAMLDVFRLAPTMACPCYVCEARGVTHALHKWIVPGAARHLPVDGDLAWPWREGQQRFEAVRRACCRVNNPHPGSVEHVRIKASLHKHGWEQWQWDASAPSTRDDAFFRAAARAADVHALDPSQPRGASIVRASHVFYKLPYWRDDVQRGPDSMHTFGGVVKDVFVMAKGGEYTKTLLESLSVHERTLQSGRWPDVVAHFPPKPPAPPSEPRTAGVSASDSDSSATSDAAAAAAAAGGGRKRKGGGAKRGGRRARQRAQRRPASWRARHRHS